MPLPPTALRLRIDRPDVGAQIKDNGETVDPSKITISCAKKGYKMVMPKTTAVPLKAEGTYEIDFVMAKEMASN